MAQDDPARSWRLNELTKEESRMETDSSGIRSAYPGLRPVIVGSIVGWVGIALVGILLQYLRYNIHKPIFLSYATFATAQSAFAKCRAHRGNVAGR